MNIAPDSSSAEVIALAAATSNTFALQMSKEGTYYFCCDEDCYIKQTDAGTAAVSGASDNALIPAKTPLPISGRYGAKLSVIAAGVGKATLAPADKP